eukprot:NODE_4603_length_764_cov_33.017268_g4444_i0.p1 GENE.NODE_4603_length_764_cov_33.017268_g4444_i0~~NODE_4603_length_764_cov_33.017268_g4444_i0.p1  ORF type:complete len:225 (-),score=54.66 NODE_4603_length_764_cov_33.017268_g4444_i0:73-747(-)
MNVVQEIQRINAKEIQIGIDGSEDTSWHSEYKNSAYIFIGGLLPKITEGDLLCVFSQYGEPSDLHLVRDKEGKSMGFGFLAYEDQRSTILAVDNLNSIKIGGRTIRVDHVKNYKPPEEKEGEPRRQTLLDLKLKEMKELRKKLKRQFKEEHRLKKEQRAKHKRPEAPSSPAAESSQSSPVKKEPPMARPEKPAPRPEKQQKLGAFDLPEPRSAGKPKLVSGAFD